MEEEIDEIVEKIRRVLDRGPALRLAMLFGSAARGRLSPGSDLDLAILPRDPLLPLAAELDLQARLERVCCRQVDLVRLDHASTLLRWQVARDGKVLLADPPHERCRFLARAAGEHADFAPAVAVVARKFRRHLMQKGATS
jgi:predicted nucleotidyltransferase